MTLLPESDPSAIRLVTPQSVAASRDGVILIDKTEAGKIGPLEIEVTVSGGDGRSRTDLNSVIHSGTGWSPSSLRDLSYGNGTRGRTQIQVRYLESTVAKIRCWIR